MDSKFLKMAAVAFLLLAGTGFAHHSPIAFDTNVTDFAIRGEIGYVDMRNPHSVMRLKVAAEDGSATARTACAAARLIGRTPCRRRA